MKTSISLIIIFLSLSLGSFSQDETTPTLSDTSAYAKDRWKDNIRIDLNASPGTQRELRREYTPVGKEIEQPYSDNAFLFSLGINYRTNVFLGGFETFGTYFNGGVVGVNAFAMNYMTPEIDFFLTFRGGYSRPGKGRRFDTQANPYWGFGGEFYIDNLHIGLTYLNRVVGDNEPNMIKRYNLMLFIGYSFNRKTSFKKKSSI